MFVVDDFVDDPQGLASSWVSLDSESMRQHGRPHVRLRAEAILRLKCLWGGAGHSHNHNRWATSEQQQFLKQGGAA